MAKSILKASIIHLPIPTIEEDAGGGGPNNLGIDIQQTGLQQQQYWCWAAVSHAVSLFYDLSSPWQQCRIATTVKAGAAPPHISCCLSGGDKPCNDPDQLEKALKVTGNLADGSNPTDPISLQDIKQEINNGRPLCARIGWFFGAGGHFVIINGYTEPDLLDIQDPHWGQSAPSYDEFRSNYKGMGAWTHTYHTKVAASTSSGGASPSPPASDTSGGSAPVAGGQPVGMTLSTPPQDAQTIIADAVVAWQKTSAAAKANVTHASDISAALPHKVYAVSTSDIIAGTGLAKAKLVLWRFLLVRGETAVAAIDLACDDQGGNPKFNNIFVGPLVNDIRNAVVVAEGLDQVKNGNFELRALTVPGAFAEALWLKNLNEGNDLVLPIRPASLGITLPPTTEGGEPSPVVTTGAFLEALKPAANKAETITTLPD